MFDIAAKSGGRTALPDPTMIEVPERCLLRQALIWVSRGLPPVPEIAFRAAPGDLEKSDLESATPLVRFLRLGRFEIAGHLTRTEPMQRGHVQHRMIDASEYRPDPSVFVADNIDFADSRIDVTDDIFHPFRNTEIFDELCSEVNDETVLENTRVYFSRVTLLTKTLFVYCGPVLRHPSELIQAANFRPSTALCSSRH